MWHILLSVVPLFFVTPVFTEKNEGSADTSESIVLDGCIDKDYYAPNSDESQTCELLGPRLLEDKVEIKVPAGFKPPKNLEHSVEFNLPVGFYRLRHAMLSSENHFWTEAVLKDALRYKRVTQTQWDRHGNHVGLTNSDPHGDAIIGAKKETNYIMPKTKLVGESMAYETAVITEFNNHCFVLKKVTLTPDVPFGNKFEAHTQIVVINTGKDTCRMICSVEAKFPHGPPFGIAWKIKSGMKTGTMEVFRNIQRAILECAAGVEKISTYC